MKNPKVVGKVIAAALAGTMLLSLSSVAFAKSQNASENTKTKSNITAKKPNKQMNKEMNMTPMKGMTETLASLVKAGTITQEQSDKINEYLTAKQTARKAEADKIKNMTAEERKAYFEANKPNQKVDFLKDLVDQKVITQDQADAIKKAMPKMNKPGQRGMKLNLDAQVKAGVITQAEADKIKAYMDQKRTDRQAEMDKVKAMTEEERATYFKDKKAEAKVDLFSELVKQGILSQEKADALKAAVAK